MSGSVDVAGSPSARRECKACGNHIGNVSKIRDLENEVRFLTEKATAAGTCRNPLPSRFPSPIQVLIRSETADKLADYEEELRALKTTNPSQNNRTDSPVDPTLLSPDGATDPTSFLSSRPDISRQTSSSTIGRFSFLSTRKPLPAPPTSSSQPSTLADLQSALAKEVAAREQAEAKVAALSVEIEDLSVTLFEQANEMVATERRARARLEERVSVLEVRDREKNGRLERIERAQERLERVRALLDHKPDD